MTQLDSFVSSQKEQVESLQNDLNSQQSNISSLQKELSDSTNQVVELYRTVDQENAANLNVKLSNLITTLVDVDKWRRNNQGNLENGQEGWTAKLKLFEDQAAKMSRDNANKKRADEIENLLNKLDKLNKDRNQVAMERDEMESKLLTDGNKDAIGLSLQKEFDSLTLKVRWASDEIEKTHNELEELLKSVEFKKTFITEQQDIITTITTEITEIRVRITDCTTTIKSLEEDVGELNGKVEEFQRLLADQDDEIEKLNKQLAQRLKRLAELEGEVHINKYIAVKGDNVDEMLAQYIQDCPVPVKRLGGGFYLFGLRKIYAKIMNGKLVIRVGGGYMIISEFIETYADQEIQKLIRVAEREGVDSISELDLEAIALGPKSPTGQSSNAGSPSARSPMAKSPKGMTSSFSMSSLNGSSRKTMQTNKRSFVKTMGGKTTTTTTTTTFSSTMKSPSKKQ